MSENENTPVATQAAPAVPAAPFGEVFAKVKNFKNEFLSLNGRARRGEYWTTFLVFGLPLIFITIYSLIAGALSFNMTIFATIGLITSICWLLLFPISVRRWHDFGLPAWVAVGIQAVDILTRFGVPAIGSIVGLASFVFMLLPGSVLPGGKGTNAYGADPLNPEDKAEPTKKEPTLIVWAAIVAVTFINWILIFFVNTNG